MTDDISGLIATADRLADKVDGLTQQVDALDGRLGRTRRTGIYVTVVGVLAAASVAVTIHDEHIEHCGPGAPAISDWCDRLFPLHDH